MFGQSLLSGAFGSSLDPAENFNITKYTGNGDTSQNAAIVKTITTGFEPDLVIIKNLNQVNDEWGWYDATRGYNQSYGSPWPAIGSNSSGPENFAGYNGGYYWFYDFLPTGFSLGNDTSERVNKSGREYISYSWKGGADVYSGKFNGSISYITLPNSIETAYVSAGEFAVSAWFRTTTIPTGTNDEQFIVSLYETGYLDIRLKANGILQGKVAEASSGTDREATSPSGTIVVGKWYHVVWTGTTNDLKLYINGTLSGSNSTWNGTFYTSSAGCSIGSKNAGTDDWWNGNINQFRLFPTNLSASQVTSLYNETAATINTLDFPAGAGCLTGYTLNKSVRPIGFNSTTDVSTCDFPSGAGCQLLYQFDNNVTDTCGSYDGTAGGTLIYSTGVLGSAIDTTSGYVDTGYTFPADSTMSVSFWMKMTANPGSDVYMLSDMDSGAGNLRLAVRIAGSYSNKLYIDISDGSSSDAKDTGWIPTEDVWYNVVITFNGTAVILYIDGISTSSYTSSVAFGTAGAQQQVIGRPGAYTSCCNFPGLIDQFRIFTSTLTQSQVTELARGNQYSGFETSMAYEKPGFLGRNNDGTIESQVSANVDAGFSIVKWSGSTSSSSQSVGHGLGKSPELVILKNLDVTDAWYTYAEGATGNNQYLKLNTTDAVFTAGSDSWGAGPTSSVMGLRPGTFSSSSSYNIIMYCWTSIPKYSKIGTYSGTGATKNITLGFKPAWVLFKSYSSNATNAYWTIFDNKRNPVNERDCEIYPNSNHSQFCISRGVNFTDTGIELLSTSYSNESGVDFIYMAFAE